MKVMLGYYKFYYIDSTDMFIFKNKTKNNYNKFIFICYILMWQHLFLH